MSRMTVPWKLSSLARSARTGYGELPARALLRPEIGRVVERRGVAGVAGAIFPAGDRGEGEDRDRRDDALPGHVRDFADEVRFRIGSR
jgi:hypothetical protein